MNAWTFLLRVRDRPGALEAIVATFSHRGVSIEAILTNEGALDTDGLATVLVTFRATPARKEALRSTLARLARVASVEERAPDDPALRQSALVRLCAGASLPADAALHLTRVDADPESGETVWALFGPPARVRAAVDSWRDAGVLRAATVAFVAV